MCVYVWCGFDVVVVVVVIVSGVLSAVVLCVIVCAGVDVCGVFVGMSVTDLNMFPFDFMSVLVYLRAGEVCERKHVVCVVQFCFV